MRINELALKAGRQLQSPQTGLIHFCYENKSSRDTIPTLENVAFALALMRSRMSDQVLEGKAILEKLLAFEVGGNFPVYLHQFPACHDWKMPERLSPYFYWIVREFGSVLGSLKNQLEPFIRPPQLNLSPQSAADWAELCIAAQMAERLDLLQEAAQHWNSALGLYTGPSFRRSQEEGQPALSLLDLMMGEWTGHFSRRALQFHPLHLRASIIQPAQVTAGNDPVFILKSESEVPLYIAWGSSEQLHTFTLAKKHLHLVGDEIFFSEEVPEEENYELAFYLNVHPDHQILFNGKKASAFRLEDEVRIESKEMTITLRFLPGQGKGQFFGHLMRGNRPSQLESGVYDWKIALRTISREKHFSLRLQQKLDYRQPHPLHADHYPHKELPL